MIGYTAQDLSEIGKFDEFVRRSIQQRGRVDLPPGIIRLDDAYTFRRLSRVTIEGNNTSIVCRDADCVFRFAQFERVTLKGLSITGDRGAIEVDHWQGRGSLGLRIDGCLVTANGGDAITLADHPHEPTCADIDIRFSCIRAKRYGIVSNGRQSVRVNCGDTTEFFGCEAILMQRAGGLARFRECYSIGCKTWFAMEGDKAGGSSNQPAVSIKDCACDDAGGFTRIIDLSRLRGYGQVRCVVEDFQANIDNGKGEGFDLFRLSPEHQDTEIHAARITKTGNANTTPTVGQEVAA